MYTALLIALMAEPTAAPTPPGYFPIPPGLEPLPVVVNPTPVTKTFGIPDDAAVEWVAGTKPTRTKDKSDDALDEVNEYRAKRGLPPFRHDPGLTAAAKLAAETRAKHLWAGHLQSDFACLPAGVSADSAGCGALEDSWGWGTCCMDDNYSHAGAAWVRGTDGKRYMHLFVRGKQSEASSVASKAITSTAEYNAVRYENSRPVRRLRGGRSFGGG